MDKVKGVVIEIKDNTLVLLTKEGNFIKVPYEGKDAVIGKEIELDQSTGKKDKRWFFPAAVLTAAVLVLFFLVPGLFPGTADEELSPVAYVSIDINPSVELGITEDLTVVEKRAFNKEGEKILEGLPSGADLYFSLDYLLQRSIELSYLDAGRNDNLVMLTLVIEKELELNEAQLESRAKNMLNEKGIEGFITAKKATPEERGKALEHEVSVNRYQLQLEKNKDTVRLELLQEQPLGKILEEVRPDFKKDFTKTGPAVIPPEGEGKEQEKNGRNLDGKEEDKLPVDPSEAGKEETEVPIDPLEAGKEEAEVPIDPLEAGKEEAEEPVGLEGEENSKQDK